MKSILVMEDEALVRQGLVELLETAGFNAQAVADGNQGLEIAAKTSFDLAIVDIFMPLKDGIATIMELKKLSPLLKVIAISGGGNIVRDFDYLEYAQALGAVKCFQKPVNPDELLETIAAVI